MIEKFIISGVVLIYATGCLASIVEIYDQEKSGESPSANELAVKYPALNILAMTVMVAGWPLVLTWHSVRRGWR